LKIVKLLLLVPLVTGKLWTGEKNFNNLKMYSPHCYYSQAAPLINRNQNSVKENLSICSHKMGCDYV